MYSLLSIFELDMLERSISICGGRFKCHCMSAYRESLPVPITVPEVHFADAWLPWILHSHILFVGEE